MGTTYPAAAAEAVAEVVAEVVEAVADADVERGEVAVDAGVDVVSVTPLKSDVRTQA